MCFYMSETTLIGFDFPDHPGSKHVRVKVDEGGYCQGFFAPNPFNMVIG